MNAHRTVRLLVSVLLAYAQGVASANCESSIATRDILICLQAELAEKESEIEKLRAQIASVLGPEEKVLYEQSDLAWASFRLANCYAARSIFVGGTMAPVVFSQCKLEMTAQRIVDLQRIYATRLERVNSPSN